MTREHRKILIKSVYTVYGVVAAADGKIDDKESAVLLRALENSRHIEVPILTEVLDDFREYLSEYVQEFTQGEYNPYSDIAAAVITLDIYCSPVEADLFKKFLMHLGVSVAEASGGFMGIGNKICKEEQAALGLIALAIHASTLR